MASSFFPYFISEIYQFSMRFPHFFHILFQIYINSVCGFLIFFILLFQKYISIQHVVSSFFYTLFQKCIPHFFILYFRNISIQYVVSSFFSYFISEIYQFSMWFPHFFHIAFVSFSCQRIYHIITVGQQCPSCNHQSRR